MFRILVTNALVIGTLSAMVRLTSACTCKPPLPACALVTRSDLVFLGKVAYSNDDGSGTFDQDTLKGGAVVLLTPALRWTAFALVLAGLCASSTVAWWQSHRSVGPGLSAWRRGSLRFGASANMISLLLYLVDLGRFQLVMRGLVGYTGTGWADSGWILLALIALGVASSLCGAVGTHAARALTIINGIAMALLWCLLGAGTSA